MNTWLQFRAVSWPVIVIGIVLLALIAGWRHKTWGVWLLAAASALAAITSAAQILMSVEFLSRHQLSLNYLWLIGFGYYAAMVLGLCGWAVLAFTRTRRDKPDA